MTAFKRNLISNAGATAIGSAAQFLLILALPNLMSVDAFASFLTAVAVIAIGEMASDFGSRIWAIKQFAISSHPRSDFFSVIVAKGVYSFGLALLVLLLPFNLLGWQQVILITCIAITQPSTDPLLWYLIGRERLDIDAAVKVVWRLSNIFLIFVFAYEGAKLLDILLVWLSTNLIRIVIVWNFSITYPIKHGKVDGRGIFTASFNVLRLSFPMGIAFLLMTIYQRLGVLLLGKVASVHSVAIYGIAFTLVASAGFVATSITLSSFPKLSKALVNEAWLEVNSVVERKLMLIMMVFLPVCIIGGWVSPWVISSFYSKDYMEASLVMFALLPGLYISSINFALKYLMNALELNWVDAFSAAIGILVFTCFLIIPSWEDVTVIAGWAWGLGEACIFLVKWFAIKQAYTQSSLKLGKHFLIFAVLYGSSFLLSDSYADWVKSFYS